MDFGGGNALGGGGGGISQVFSPLYESLTCTHGNLLFNKDNSNELKQFCYNKTKIKKCVYKIGTECRDEVCRKYRE